MKILETLNTGIFPAKVVFSMGFTKHELIAEMKKQKCDDYVVAIEKGDLTFPSETCMGSACWRTISGYNFKDGAKRKEFFFLFLSEFDFSDYHMTVLAHECVHLCQFILPLFLERDSEHEAEAYLHTHLMTQVLKILRESTPKRKKK